MKCNSAARRYRSSLCFYASIDIFANFNTAGYTPSGSLRQIKMYKLKISTIIVLQSACSCKKNAFPAPTFSNQWSILKFHEWKVKTEQYSKPVRYGMLSGEKKKCRVVRERPICERVIWRAEKEIYRTHYLMTTINNGGSRQSANLPDTGGQARIVCCRQGTERERYVDPSSDSVSKVARCNIHKVYGVAMNYAKWTRHNGFLRLGAVFLFSSPCIPTTASTVVYTPRLPAI